VYVDKNCVLSTRIFVYGDLKFSREFSGLWYHMMGGYQRYERICFLSFRVEVIKYVDKKQVLKFLDPYQTTQCHNWSRITNICIFFNFYSRCFILRHCYFSVIWVPFLQKMWQVKCTFGASAARFSHITKRHMGFRPLKNWDYTFECQAWLGCLFMSLALFRRRLCDGLISLLQSPRST